MPTSSTTSFTIKIHHRWTGAVLFECAADAGMVDATTGALLGFAAKEAVKGGANLSDANLRGANLRDANLCDANLRDANLSDANLRDANLSGANLRDADLRSADLCDADLCDANLRDANLSDANLRDADLRDANLCGVNLRGANLRGANLRDAKQDFLAEVLRLPNELEFLRDALIAGAVDGSTYSGECACLAGTLAHARGAEVGAGGWLEALPGTDTAFSVSASSPREVFFTAIAKGDTPETNPASALALSWTEEAIRIRDMIRATAPAPATVSGILTTAQTLRTAHFSDQPHGDPPHAVDGPAIANGLVAVPVGARTRGAGTRYSR
jgi:hypothetical protein